jgi:hypothetical protein
MVRIELGAIVSYLGTNFSAGTRTRLEKWPQNFFVTAFFTPTNCAVRLLQTGRGFSKSARTQFGCYDSNVIKTQILITIFNVHIA